MAKTPSSFEERLARIAQSEGITHSDTGHAPTPQPKQVRAKPPSGIPPLLRPLLMVVMVLAGVVGYLIVSSEENVVAAMKATAQAEQEGRTTFGTLMSSANGSMGDLALSYANKKSAEIIQAKIDSGEWTPEQAERARAAQKAREGKSTTDIVRDGMRGTLMFQAVAAGHEALGQAFSDKLDRCRSVECLSVVETEFAIALRAAREG